MRRTTTGKVLVLGGDYRMNLPIARSLGRKGIEVHVAWCRPNSPTLRSRYVAREPTIPRFALDDDSWCEALHEIWQRERYDLIIPAAEFENVVCQSRRAALGPDLPLYLLSPEAYRATIDKIETARLARGVGVSYPKTIVVTATDDLDAALDSVALPAVVKPCSSHAGGLEPNAVKRFVQRVYDRGELRRAVDGVLERQSKVLVQALVTGRGVGVEVLAHEGTILFSFQHERLHETVGHGSAYRESSPVDPELLAAAQRLLGAIRYTGVAMIEFRVDRTSGRWYLMEINGRFWGSLALPVACGADFPYFLYEMLVRDRRSFPPGYQLGVRARHLHLDVLWFARQIMPPKDRRNQGWDFDRVPRRQLVRDLLRAVTFRDRLDTFAGDDLRPGLTLLVSLMTGGSWTLGRRAP